MATILVVDDRAMNRQFLAALLSYKGHRAVEATNGAEALKQVAVERPDLVIADILMPEMDGYQFVSQLRSDPSLVTVPVIFYTAHYLQDEARTFADTCGIKHILTKPAEPQEILSIIEEALSQPAAAIAPAPPEEFNRKHAHVVINKLYQKAEMLRESEERYRTLIESTFDMVQSVAPDGSLLFVNRAWQETLGYSDEEARRLNIFDIIHPDSIEHCRELFSRVMAGESLKNFEAAFVAKDGRAVFVEGNAAAHKQDGEVTAGYGFFRDVTERKRAEEIIKQRAEEMAALQSVLLDVTAEHDLPALLRIIVERAAELLKAPAGGMYLCDPELREVRCVVSYNFSRDYTGVTLRYGEGAAGWVAETGEPLIIDDYRQWPNPSRVYAREQVLTGVLTAPIKWQGRVIGIISIVCEGEKRRFTEADMKLLEMFANHAAIAIEKARLIEREQQARRVAEVMRLASEALTRSLDLDTVLETLVDYLKQLVPYDSANVLLLGKDSRLTVRVARGYEQWTGAEKPRAIVFDANPDPILRAIVREGKSRLIADAGECDEWQHIEGAEHVRSWIGVPLVAGGEIIGVYSMDKAEPNFFTQEHLRLAESLAAQAAVAIQNAHLYEQSRQYAVELAQRLAEQQLAEEALQQSEIRFRSLIEKSSDAIALFSAEAKILYSSPAVAQILGFSVNEFVGAKAIDLVHPDDRRTIKRLFAEMLQGHGWAVAAEFRVKHKDGSWRWIDGTATNLLADPNIGAVVINYHDVTERRQAEEALRESEARLRRLVESNLIGIILADTTGRVIDANDAFLKMVGYTREDLLAGNMRWSEMTPPEYLPLSLEALRQLQETGAVAPFEKEYLRKDGSRVPVLLGVAMLEGSEQETVAFVIDLTERKQAEEQLRALTARLQNIREEERTRIAREVHDELGQALTGLKMDLSWIINRLPQAGDKKVSRLIEDRSKGMFDLIAKTIKTVRKISSDLRPGVLDDLGLVAAIEWQANDFQNRTGIRCKFDAAVEHIELDREVSTAVFRIFQETLTNVARHADATRVEIKLNRSNGNLVLEVTDNGKGITKQDIAGKKSLGLLGMRERAHIVGGEVTLRGARNKGTTVIVEVPIEPR
ncbi:MAG TPA: PAS domain S-box protein [Blastocatellia bacterium]|nr:PAS domain S-box protein [Blastocatellia bacterium]